MVSKNHLPGFSTLASNSVMGGAKGGSLLITSDGGAPANHTHYSALTALLLYHKSNSTIVFVPPKFG